MQIIKKVAVKHVLTERMREKMMSDLKKDQERLEKEIEQLRFQMQKQLKSVETIRRSGEIRERFHKEIDKRKDKIHSSDFQRSQLEQLPLHSEISSGYVDAMEEIEEGAEWPSPEQEIVVRDGEIIKIRQNRTDNDDGMV
ncbi:hypothetical protein D7Z54_21430 [Salibacterium salarium]|uniref:YlqD protein n=1 Tax=Salibacterium salarium TaxID=284579 RepID=A0A3R9PI89_9BACI|nr:YlqD family protein [Salibacterium salarium]RSL31254.1 hypothetical protein D7Z54_21430 [Salibacterium salarium]